MKRVTVAGVGLALLLSGCVGAPGTTPMVDAADGINQSDALLAELLETQRPGCSAAVAMRGELQWSGAVGVADRDSAIPLTPRSVFDFASVSKQFTGMAIVLLDHEGALSLSDELALWLPDLPHWAGDVTIGDLLHQRSGIPDYTELLTDQGVRLLDVSTQQDAVDAIASVEVLNDEPGSIFEYSNSNYVLLAEVAEAASGQPLPEMLTARVFNGHDLRLDPGFEEAVRAYEEDEPVVSLWEQIGDGSVFGSPSELVLWADHYRTGAVGGQEVVRTATTDTVPTDDSDGSGYGAGIDVAADGSLGHEGSWAGSVSVFEVSPDRETVIAVSCNSSEGPATSIADGLHIIWT